MTGETAQQKTVRKEMGITHKDFYAELPVLLENIPYRQHQDTISFQLHGKNVEIILGPELLRELGPTVRLPVTVVTLRFHAFTEQEVRDFVGHFNLRFMKGGG